MAATLVLMPRLSPTLEEGVLAKWLKKEGDKISPGDVIAEVETDKANMDFPLEDEGVLLKLLAVEGQTIKLGAPVAILGNKGDSIEALQASLAGSSTVQATTGLSSVSKLETAPVQQSAGISVQASSLTKSDVVVEKSAVQLGASSVIKASPLARAIAKQAGVSLSAISGSGPLGRVVKSDVMSYLETATKTSHVPTMTHKPVGEASLIPLSMMRKTIARRLVESKRNVPHFYLTVDVDVDALGKFREGINQNADKEQPKISFNDLVVKATALALKKNPEAHRFYTDEGYQSHQRVDMGIAVGLPDGLITPVIKGADGKSILDIAKEIRSLAERAKQKKLDPSEYQGATFSVSNLGMYGIREFSAIINPPESGILAVGSIEKRAVVVEQEGKDTVTVRKMMTLTLSCDHRVIDGVLGAKLLGDIKKALEQPLQLVF